MKEAPTDPSEPCTLSTGHEPFAEHEHDITAVFGQNCMSARLHD